MTVSAEVQSLISELKQWDEKIASLANQFSQQSAESTRRAGQATSDLERLQADLADSIRREEALQQELDRQRLIVTNLQREQEESRKQLAKVVVLEREKEASSATIQRLEEQLSLLQRQCASSQDAVVAAETATEALRQELSKQKLITDSMQREREESHKQVAKVVGLEREKEESSATIKRLEEQLSLLQRQCASSQDAVVAAETATEALRQELSKQKLITDSMQREREESHKQVAKVVGLEREKEESSATIKRLEEQLSLLQEKYAALQKAAAGAAATRVVAASPAAGAAATRAAAAYHPAGRATATTRAVTLNANDYRLLREESTAYYESGDYVKAYPLLCQVYAHCVADETSSLPMVSLEVLKARDMLVQCFIGIFKEDCKNGSSSQYKNTITAITKLPPSVDAAIRLLEENEKGTFDDNLSRYITRLFSSAVQMLESNNISSDQLMEIFALVERILADLYFDFDESVTVSDRVRTFESSSMFDALQNPLNRAIRYLRQLNELESQKESVSGRDALFSQIQVGVSLCKVDPLASATSAETQASGATDLLSQIRTGISLRRVEQSVKQTPVSRALTIFEQAMEERRRHIEGKNTDEADTDGDDWDNDGSAASSSASNCPTNK